MLKEIGSVLWALLVTCLVLFLAYWFTRHVVGRLSIGRTFQRHMTVLEKVSLGRDQRLVLAQVGDTLYLLGVTPGGISCLRVLSEEEAAPWRRPEEPPTAPMGRTSFREALRKVLEQRKR
jgi:flagellar protein FliO/FliZ